MARPRRYSDDDVLDAALTAVAQHGRDVTIAHVTEALGAPVATVYYRFPTRTHLMVSLWMRCVRRFQAGVLAATEIEDAQAALEECARHVVRYCADHPAEARGLTLYRQDVLLSEAPDDLRDTVATLNDEVFAAMGRLIVRRYGSATSRRVAIVRTAVQLCPYGLVRPYVGGPLPDFLEEAAVEAARGILRLESDA